MTAWHWRQRLATRCIDQCGIYSMRFLREAWCPLQRACGATIHCINVQWFTAFAGCLLPLSVIHHSVHLNSKHQPEVGSIAAGGSFGELALLYFAPRAATIQVKNVKSIWCADSIDVHRTNPPGANWSGSGCLCSLGHRPQALQGRICFVSASKWEIFLDWNVKGWA